MGIESAGTMSPQMQLLALSAVLLLLIGVILLVVLRFRSAARQDASVQTPRLSEEAFMAMAMREALNARAGGAERGPAVSASRAGTAFAASPLELDDLPIGVLATDEAGLLRTANLRARTLLGLASPSTGRPFRDTLAGVPALAALFDRAIRTRTSPGRVRLSIGSPEDPGSGRLVEAEILPILRDGGFRGTCGVLVDLGGQAADEALRQQQEIDRRVASLASGLAHELANSMTAVHGYSRMIDVSALSELDRSSLVAVQHETSAMSETLDAFRRIVRPIEPVRDTFPLTHLTGDVVALVERQQGLMPGAVSGDVPAGIQVYGDRVLLEEALAHVVRNAIEACQQAGLPVVVSLSAALDPAHDQVLLTVRDRGPGVPDVDRARLFEPFFSTKPERAGFGLAHARHILLAHGGRIWAAHPDDGGLAVALAIPLAKSAASAADRR